MAHKFTKFNKIKTNSAYIALIMELSWNIKDFYQIYTYQILPPIKLYTKSNQVCCSQGLERYLS